VPLTVRELLEVLTADPSSGLDRGRLKAVQRRCDSVHDSAIRHLIAELLETPPRQAELAVRVPWASVAPSYRAEPRELTASDLLWLQRLPGDPEAISDDDLRELAKLAMDVEPRSADARLVDSIFGPAQRIHERRAAEAALEAAKATSGPGPALPAGAERLLAETIASETPGLTEDEALGRAGATLADAVVRRDAAREKRTAQARAAVDELDEHGPTPLRRARSNAGRFGTADADDRFQPVETVVN